MNHRGIWLTATVLAVVVLLAQVAGASTTNATASLATSASVSAEVADTAVAKSLPEQASSVGREKSANGLATASASINEAVTDRAETTEATENEANDVTVKASAAAPKDSTTGARPGWGCGDTNHKHSGPPGRPGATPPPNCKP
jgi:type II secretory pathway pseudopilin PulG